MNRVMAWGIGLLGMALAAGGCSQPYVAGYTYYPQPATVEVLKRDGDQRSPLMVLASVMGVHNADEKKGIPYSVVVRMRFENVAQSKVSFDPASLELVSGSLRAFGRPKVDPPGAMTLSANDRRELTAYFPFPPGLTAGQMSLRNLRLRWEVTIDSTPVVQTAVFERVEDGGYGGENDVDY